LADAWDDAPRANGVYEVGFFRAGYFNRLYVGRSVGTTVTIRSRLSSHANGGGSAAIREYLTSALRDNLYCRWQVTESGQRREVNLLRRRGIDDKDPNAYNWNRRMEYRHDR
jgi:hypothetical protein